jgi:hypothetical protein
VSLLVASETFACRPRAQRGLLTNAESRRWCLI